MLESQGGRAAYVEMTPGGFIGKYQIHKVNKSTATGRVVSVSVKVPKVSSWTYKTANVPGTDYALSQIDTERLPADAYRAPTDPELAAFNAERKAEKASRPVTKSTLVNPTDADAERLQAIWNAARSTTWEKEEKPVRRLTQSEYSRNSGGSYSACETKDLAAGGLEPRRKYGEALEASICKVRFLNRSVIVLTDKPQKPLPAEVFNDPRAAQLAIVQESISELQTIDKLLRGSMSDASKLLTDEQSELFRLARLVGYAYYDSLSQRGWTTKALEYSRQNPPAKIEAEIYGKRVTIDNDAETVTQELLL